MDEMLLNPMFELVTPSNKIVCLIVQWCVRIVALRFQLLHIQKFVHPKVNLYPSFQDHLNIYQLQERDLLQVV